MANIATSLLGRYIPNSYGLTDEDKGALARQGLLALGLGILGSRSGGSLGTSLGDGLKSGLLAINQGADNIADARYKAQLLANQAGGGTEFQALDKKLRAAGFEPGSDEYKNGVRVSLGIDPRASSAAISYQKVMGPDGIDRLVALDPRAIGAQVVGDGTGYGSFSQPATQQPLANPAADFMDLARQFPGAQMTSATRTPEHNRAVGGMGNSQHLSGTASDFAVPPNVRPAFLSAVKQLGYQAIDEGDHIHVQKPRGGTPNLFASRPKEQEAAAVAGAQAAATLPYTQAEIAYRTDQGIRGAAGEAAAKGAVELQQSNAAAANEKARAADSILGLVGEARKYLPQAGEGMFERAVNQANQAIGRSTPQTRANQQLRIIAGQLTSAQPKMSGPQSDKDVQLYREMAGDVANESLPIKDRLAALNAIEEMQRKYSGRSAPASTGPRRLKYNPATGKIE